MTPEQLREIRDALIAVDRRFQRETGADVPGQKREWDEDYDTWKAVKRAQKIIDAEVVRKDGEGR
jgi:hypothetical protein